MERRKYSVDEKKEMVRTYRRATQSYRKMDPEEIAKWCNNYYGLADELHGYDFRRPKEMRDWIDEVNREIIFGPGP